MTRIAFLLLAATLVTAGLAWWGSPDAVPVSDALQAPGPVDATSHVTPRKDPATSAPEADEAVATADRVDSAAPPAAAPPPPDASADGAAAWEMLTPPAPFPGEHASSASDADPDTPDALPAPPASGTEEPAPRPVDVERSGDLIRRMLAVYEAMRE